MRHQLVCHPDTPNAAIDSLWAEATRDHTNHLRILFHLSGVLDEIRLAPPGLPQWADGLWQRSCLEAFVRPVGGDAYVELNFSPSLSWAAYEFDTYRHGMRAAGLSAPPDLKRCDSHSTLEMTTRTDLSAVPALAGAGAWHVGVSAVIESADGTISYWALAHPAGKPDFHHADCFAAQLAIAEGS